MFFTYPFFRRQWDVSRVAFKSLEEFSSWVRLKGGWPKRTPREDDELAAGASSTMTCRSEVMR